MDKEIHIHGAVDFWLTPTSALKLATVVVGDALVSRRLGWHALLRS